MKEFSTAESLMFNSH